MNKNAKKIVTKILSNPACSVKAIQTLAESYRHLAEIGPQRKDSISLIRTHTEISQKLFNYLENRK